MILTIKVIVTVTSILITMTIKYRGRYRTPTTTNTELLVTLHNGRKIFQIFITNIYHKYDKLYHKIKKKSPQ